MSTKASESRLRRHAKRLGLIARKVRNDGYGNSGWFFINPTSNFLVGANWPNGCTMALDSEQAAEWLDEYQLS